MPLRIRCVPSVHASGRSRIAATCWRRTPGAGAGGPRGATAGRVARAQARNDRGRRWRRRRRDVRGHGEVARTGGTRVRHGQGVHARVVMETLGHSQISITINTYAHVMPALGMEAAERMDAAMVPARGGVKSGVKTA